MTNCTAKRHRIWIELFLIILIVGCLSYIVTSIDTYHDLKYLTIDENGSLIVLQKDDHENINKYEQTSGTLIEYRPDACRLIEIYDSTFDLVFQMKYEVVHSEALIEEHPDLKEQFLSKQNGKISIDDGGDSFIVIYQWIRVKGSNALLVYAESNNAQCRLERFNFVCYAMLILIFILFTILLFRQYKSITGHYHAVSGELQKQMIQ